MTVTLSLVLILGAAVGFLVRYMGLRLWHALICTTFGFCLAATGLAPQINTVIQGIVRTLSGHG
jgi:hypothetical protein